MSLNVTKCLPFFNNLWASQHEVLLTHHFLQALWFPANNILQDLRVVKWNLSHMWNGKVAKVNKSLSHFCISHTFKIMAQLSIDVCMVVAAYNFWHCVKEMSDDSGCYTVIVCYCSSGKKVAGEMVARQLFFSTLYILSYIQLQCYLLHSTSRISIMECVMSWRLL